MAFVPEAGVPVPTRRRGLHEVLSEPDKSFTDHASADLGPLLERIDHSRVALIGEASHGTSEFYTMRARITKELIQREEIRFVALEADWPDAARIDDWVRHIERDEPPDPEHAFSRFPTWMWRNEEVLEFVDWLRDWNAERSPEDRVAIHGLDLYSLSESIAQVVAFLEQVDPELATVARHRYGCMNPYVTDPAIYGYAAWTGKHRSCEEQAVAVLRELLARRLDYIERTSVERVFDAEANARVVADAERYYRTMYQGGSAAWNLRDEHMFDILLRLLDHYGPDARAVVWAHNSHLGDARATEMSQRGELNVGQLVRQHFKLDAFAIGFGTHSGTVAAARQWDEPVTIMRVRPSLDESYERVFHDSLLAGAFVPLRPGVAPDIREELEQSRLERAIGVIYRPETERQSHYFGALLPDQFDEYIWLDLTHAIRPLGPAKAPPAPGHPFAPLDI